MSIEKPPPYNPNNPQQWAEELVDYLIRRLAEIERRLQALEP